MLISEIINAAFRKIGVVADGQSATADEAADALEAFNLMVSAWLLDGIDVWRVPGNDPFAEVHDWHATDVFPLPPAFREGAVYLLAAKISPEFSLPPMFDENAYRAKMRAAFVDIAESAMPSALVRGAVYPTWRVR